MKKLIFFLTAVFLFVSCTAKPEDTAPKDYEKIVSSVLTSDEKESFSIITMQSENSDNIYDMLLLEKDSIEDFAVAISLINTNAFCTGVFTAKPDKQDEVYSALNEYLLSQSKSMENYLPDQLDIVKNAEVKKVGKTQVFIALGPNSSTEAESLKKLLK